MKLAIKSCSTMTQVKTILSTNFACCDSTCEVLVAEIVGYGYVQTAGKNPREAIMSRMKTVQQYILLKTKFYPTHRLTLTQPKMCLTSLIPDTMQTYPYP